MINCAYCAEPVLPGETVPVGVAPFLQNIHRECAIRMVVGSAAHQLGDCSCAGGTREDPPGMTLRQAARFAVETLEALQQKHAALKTGIGHIVNDYKKCPVDPAHEGFEVLNYDEIWRDGDVHCLQCGAFIRTYDAG